MRPPRSGPTSARKISTPPSRRSRLVTARSGSARRRSPRPGGSELTVRIATAVIGIPLVLFVDHVGGWAFAAAVGLVAAVGAIELFQMLHQAQYRPFSALGIVAAVGLAVLPAADRHPQAGWIATTVGVLLLASLYYLQPATFQGQPLLNWSLTLVPPLYVGLLLGHLTLLRDLAHGVWWVVAVLVITWAYDTGAYFTGRAIGKHTFMAHASPNKTREGVLGGLLLAGVAGLVTVPTIHVPLWQGFVFGLILGLVAQAGDLVESMIKRQVGVKDAGSLIPGHGGLLDRIDSLLFTGAVAYYIAVLAGYAA